MRACLPARYAKTDAASLAYLRRELLRPHYTAVEVGAGVAVAATAVGGPTHTHILAVCGTLAQGDEATLTPTHLNCHHFCSGDTYCHVLHGLLQKSMDSLSC